MADRILTHEDRIVWEKITRTVRSYSARHSEPAALESMHELLDGKKSDQVRAKPESMPESSAPRPVPAIQELHRIERPVVKKLARGRLDIDARIDLHGLKRSEAHDLLLDFLSRAHRRGMRHVLVITGKGSSGGSEGVLKREVPIWLNKPEFRILASGLETSSRGHGGEGALYIRLRRHGNVER